MKSFYKACLGILTLTAAVGVGTYYSHDIQVLLKDGKGRIEHIYRPSPVPRVQAQSRQVSQQESANGSSQSLQKYGPSSQDYLAESQVQLPARVQEAPPTPEQRLKKIEGLLENLVQEVGAVGEQTATGAYDSVSRELKSTLQKAELIVCQEPLTSFSRDIDATLDKYLTPEAQGQRYLHGILSHLSQLDAASYGKLAAAVSAGRLESTNGYDKKKSE
ncbi:hypothetical protein HYU21_01230 [Candidatus Woesearchaeota archaeon]|nr:hypothetical protein [Candidatus Woesearchaeota archaeon]